MVCAPLLTALALLVPAALPAQEITATFTPLGDVQPVAFIEAVESPNGRHVVAVFHDSAGVAGFMRFDRATGRYTRHSPIGAGFRLTMSPDGRFFAYNQGRTGPAGPRHIWVTPADSATSLPSGATRRVTTRPGAAPAFSPDGRTIAFRWTEAGRSLILTVPFSGGEERVVLERAGAIGPPYWSRDGRFLYAAWSRTGQPTYVLRVAASGGRVDTAAGPLTLSGFPQGDTRAFMGVSGDGTRLLQGGAGVRQAIVLDTSGQELGRLTVPIHVALNRWSAVTPGRILAIEQRGKAALLTVSMADGAIRQVTSGRRFDHNPAWSPGGSHLAFAALVDGHYRIVISGADGTGARIVAEGPEAIGAPSFFPDGRSIAWSPDGRFVAYAPGSPAALAIIDVAAGRLLREIVVDSLQEWAGTFTWRDDSRGLVYIRPSSLPGAPPREWEARLVELDGRDRLLRSLPEAVLPREVNRGLLVVSDSVLLVLRVDSVVAIPLTRGPPRTLHRGPMLNNSVDVSHDRRWMTLVTYEPGRQSNGIVRVISIASGETRSPPADLDLPILGARFLPDGKLLVRFRRSRDGRTGLAVVSLGSAPPRIVTVGGPVGLYVGHFAASPDGRMVVFEASGPVESRFMDVDLDPGTRPARSARSR